MPKKEKWKGKAMEIRGSWAKLFDARPSDFLAYPFECLPVCLPVRRLMMVMQSEHSCPQKYQLLFLSLSVVAGANVYQLQRDSPSVSLGDLGFVTTRHYPDSGERRHLNATCVQDSGFVNFQPRELKGGTPTRLIEYAHYGIPS